MNDVAKVPVEWTDTRVSDHTEIDSKGNQIRRITFKKRLYLTLITQKNDTTPILTLIGKDCTNKGRYEMHLGVMGMSTKVYRDGRLIENVIKIVIEITPSDYITVDLYLENVFINGELVVPKSLQRF